MPLMCQAEQLNLYLWAGQIPDKIIRQFSQETGIKVNTSNFDSNEMMYAKLISNPNIGYDIISPSNYYVQKLKKANLLLTLDKNKLPNVRFLDKKFTHLTYDPTNDYTIPLQWGATGIVVNRKLLANADLKTWKDLWHPQYQHKLMLLDDLREVFSIALISLGYNVNDHDHKHIEEAYKKLKILQSNVKLYNSNSLIPLLIDEDIIVGMAWNAETAKAQHENPALEFIYPSDGYTLWIDNLAISRQAPHPIAAHRFINFMMRPDISAKLMIAQMTPVPNTGAYELIPQTLRHNETLFPNQKILAKSQLILELPTTTVSLLEHYWQQLRLS